MNVPDRHYAARRQEELLNAIAAHDGTAILSIIERIRDDGHREFAAVILTAMLTDRQQALADQGSLAIPPSFDFAGYGVDPADLERLDRDLGGSQN